MGCWEETCAVTHSPIFEDEEVVLIVPKTRYVELVHKHRGLAPWYRDGQFIQSTELLQYGTYDDYGWIKEIESPKRVSDLQPIFVLREIWDQITNNWSRYGHLCSQERFENQWKENGENPHYERPKISKEDAGKFFLLIEFAYCARIDLTSGLAFRGSQVAYDCGDGYVELAKLLSARAKKVRKKMNED